MHWRGDRANGFFGSTQPRRDGRGPLVPQLHRRLPGPGRERRRRSPTSDMQEFTDFQLQVQLPPNPMRELDNSLTPAQRTTRTSIDGASGIRVLHGRRLLRRHRLIADVRLHLQRLPRARRRARASSARAVTRASRTRRRSSRSPHLRNLYQKVGMFGMPDVPFFNGTRRHATTRTRATRSAASASCTTAATDTRLPLLARDGVQQQQQRFGMTGFDGRPAATTSGDVEQFVLAFDTDLAPIVGQQVTLTSTNVGDVGPRVDVINDARGRRLHVEDARRRGRRVRRRREGRWSAAWRRAGTGARSRADFTAQLPPDDGGPAVDAALARRRSRPRRATR